MEVRPLGGVLRYFETVPDPRRFNVTYTLPQLLSCVLMAVLCRCDDYEEIAGWTLARHDWLAVVLGLPEHRSPSRKTFERLLRRLDPAALQGCFIELTQRLAEKSAGRLIAIEYEKLEHETRRPWGPGNRAGAGDYAATGGGPQMVGGR